MQHTTSDKKDRLQWELGFHELLAEVAISLIYRPDRDVLATVKGTLQRMSDFVGADRSYVFEYDFDSNTASNTIEWCAEDITPQIDELQGLPLEAMSPWVREHQRGEAIIINNVDSWPEQSTRELLQSQGILSLITVPLMRDATCTGFVGFDSVLAHRQYGEADVRLLRVFAQMLINVKRQLDTEAALVTERERLQTIVDGTAVATWIWWCDTARIEVNDHWARMLGYELSDLEPISYWTWHALCHPQDVQDVETALERHLRGETEVYEAEYRMQHRDGSWHWVLSHGRVVQRAVGGNARVVAGMQQDISARKAREQHLRNSEQHYRGLVESLDGNFHFYTNNLEGVVTYISPSAAARYGWRPEGSPLTLADVITDHPINDQIDPQTQRLLAGTPIVSYRAQVRDVNGKLRWLDVSESLQHDGAGAVIGVEGFAHDITDHLEVMEALAASQQQLRSLAHHDPLTGLPNRLLLLDRLQQCLASSRRHDQPFAVAYLDLDGFKAINDQHGHATGDLYLQAVARHIVQALRESDTVARLGGDEFVILLTQLPGDRAQLEALLRRLQDALRKPVEADGLRLPVSASIGVVVILNGEKTPAVDDILRAADRLMYSAKHSGKDRLICEYD